MAPSVVPYSRLACATIAAERPEPELLEPLYSIGTISALRKPGKMSRLANVYGGYLSNTSCSLNSSGVSEIFTFFDSSIRFQKSEKSFAVAASWYSVS